MPFEPWHLTWLSDTINVPWLGLSREYGNALKAYGSAYTAFAGLEVVACAGIIPMWPGRAQVWSLLSPLVERHVMTIHRVIARYIRSYQVARLECVVDPRSEKAIAWAERLGFEYESTMPRYTPQGDTMLMYRRLR